MTDTHLQRLAEERKRWRKDRPFGFVAKPATRPDGSQDLTVWNCKVPGKQDSDWDGGVYPVKLTFPSDYPRKAPKATFPAGFFHCNVYPDGKVCLSILNDDEEMGGQWKASITVKQILQGIQELLDAPNPHSPAQQDAWLLYTRDRSAYSNRVKKQAKLYPPSQEDA